MNFLAPFLEPLLRFIYPPKCLHCFVPLKEKQWFCRGCSELIEVLSPIGRCPSCFEEKGDNQTCRRCTQEGSLFYRKGAVCDYIGPAATLIKKMKYGQMPFLAEPIAAFLTAQWIRLEWETPDLIIPMPISKIRRYERGYNQAALLAEVLGRNIDVPVVDVLRRRSGDYSQAGLSMEQRTRLDPTSFFVKKPRKSSLLEVLGDKKILLIDDVMTTGTTMNICVDLLHAFAPQAIYGMVFCMTQRD